MDTQTHLRGSFLGPLFPGLPTRSARLVAFLGLGIWVLMIGEQWFSVSMPLSDSENGFVATVEN